MKQNFPRIAHFTLVVFAGILGIAQSDRGTADISFVEVSSDAGISHSSQTWGASWGDFNGDKFPDLWVSNHQRYPSLYQGLGGGLFADVTLDVVVGAGSSSDEVEGYVVVDPDTRVVVHADTHTAAWADIDNDGDQDLLELSGGGGGYACPNWKHPHMKNHLYLSDGGLLQDIAADMGIELDAHRSRNPLFFDWNQDGLLDVANGAIHSEVCSTMILEQDATGFVDITPLTGLGTASCYFLQLTDLANSGTPQVICQNHPQFPYKIFL